MAAEISGVSVGEYGTGRDQTVHYAPSSELIAALIRPLEELTAAQRKQIIELREKLDDRAGAQTLLMEALAATRAVKDQYSRAKALTGLASLLPKEQSEEIASEALATARAVSDDALRTGLLSDLKPYLPVNLRHDVDAYLTQLEARDYTRFDGDIPRADADDCLDIASDVAAFAELICLKDTPQPLSIGLFGDWGAGKSFFMEKLIEATKAVAERYRDEKESPFFSEIVQIKFNAWHYADANLWASLTAEFFDQLRLGGNEGKGEESYRNLVTTVASEVARVELEAKNAEQLEISIGTNIQQVRSTIKTLEGERADAPSSVLIKSATAALDEFLLAQPTKDQIDRAGEAIGYKTKLSDDLDKVRSIAKKAMKWHRKLQLICKALVRTRGWKLAFATGVSLLLIFLASLVEWHNFSNQPGLLTLVNYLQALPGRIMFGSAAIAMLVPAIGGAYRTVKPLFRAARCYAEDVKTREQELDREIASRRKELTGLKDEATAASQRRSETEAFLKHYQAGAAGESPAALLQYFLRESEETRAYDRYLGLVSRVRRAFETLNTLMTKQRKVPNYQANISSDIPQIERIVLYIDDLDRCQDAQVVQVLEAVHLLLAFDLFVVVVGVDARWLKHSLASYYGKQLTTSDSSDDNRASVVDYLEKIFQIPFWLRPLSFAQDGAAGTYETLIDSLVTPRPTKVKNEETDGKSQGQRVESTLADEQRRELSGGVTEKARERVTLNAKEIQLIKKLGPLAGRSPRVVKRFVNIYRLIRVRRAGEDLQGFLGQNSFAPNINKPCFPAVMFLLATDSGLRLHESSVFQNWLSGLSASDHVSDKLESENSQSVDVVLKLLSKQCCKRLESAAKAVDEALGRLLSRHDLDVARIEVSRYSFRG